MKHFIFLNYNIKVDKIYCKDDKYYFFIYNTKIYIVNVTDKLKYLEEIFRISNKLYNNKVYVNTILLTKDKKIYCEKDDKKYSLIKENSIEKDIKLNDLFPFFNIKTNLENVNLIDEWENEVDKIEKEIIEYNKEFPLVQECINYYIGMAENAISLLSYNKYEITNNND